MNLDEVKQAIEKQTGVPANLLTGETAEETIAQAKALLAYKREAPEGHKSTREQFADWINARLGNTEEDKTGEALEQIQERVRVEAGDYPILKDGNNAYINGETAPDPRSAQEQFTEWAGRNMAWTPKQDGWKPLL